jgi:two-component system sensor histidine kinase MprB
MSLRTQLTLFTALAVAASVILVSAVAYFATQDRLRSQVDDTLRTRSVNVADARDLPRREPGEQPGGEPTTPPANPLADSDTFFQVINGSGAVIGTPASQTVVLPVNSDDIAIAGGERRSVMRDVHVDGLHLRMITSPGRNGEAVQVARSLDQVDASLSSLRSALLLVGAAGIALSALLGLLVARRSLRPVARLTAAAEHVAATQDLGASIEVQRNDEIGRLATSFNQMLSALQESRQQQRQLVNDASHELRTPLTSLRTNIEVLARSDDLPEPERRELLRDVTSELEELTKLVAELVDLASDKRAAVESFEDIRLDELAAAVVKRAARRSGLRIDLDAAPTLVEGNWDLLERATGNLLDNAAKYGPADAAIEVAVTADGTFSVRDHGPGIAEVDLPRVFDRFYRAAAARSKPGSGLGLAIVKQIIEAHGGTVTLAAATGGGTLASIHLPAVAVGAESLKSSA